MTSDINYVNPIKSEATIGRSIEFLLKSHIWCHLTCNRPVAVERGWVDTSRCRATSSTIFLGRFTGRFFSWYFQRLVHLRSCCIRPCIGLLADAGNHALEYNDSTRHGNRKLNRLSSVPKLMSWTKDFVPMPSPFILDRNYYLNLSTFNTLLLARNSKIRMLIFNPDFPLGKLMMEANKMVYWI